MAKLITETSYDIQSNKDDKGLYIVGKFSSADETNGNGRIYPLNILEREVNRLQESINGKNLIGELNHPTSPEPNLERAAILVEKLEWKDKEVWGKARVLKGTPCGDIVASLIENGVRIGVSSRSLGTVGQDNRVNTDLKMICYDVVANPSTPGAWVNGIYEAKEFNYSEEPKEPKVDEPSQEELLDEAKKAHKEQILKLLKSIKEGK